MRPRLVSQPIETWKGSNSQQERKGARGRKVLETNSTHQSSGVSRGTTYAAALMQKDPVNPVENNLLVVMLGIIDRFIASSDSPLTQFPGGSFSGCFAFLTGPAVLNFLRVALTLPPGRLPEGIMAGSVLNAMECLSKLLRVCMGRCKPDMGPALFSTSDAEVDKDSAGLHLLVDPMLSMPALNADASLLHALAVHVKSHNILALTCYELQRNILKGWVMAGSLCSQDPSATARDMMIRSVIGVAKQCAYYALQLMLQQSNRGKGEGRADKSRQQQGGGRSMHGRQQNGHSTNLTDIFARLAELGLEGIEPLRGLVTVTTGFMIHYRQLPPESGFHEGE